MPLLDHFHPPLSVQRHWEAFHSSWATKIADELTERWLPPNFIAEEHVHMGASVEIDVGTFEREQAEIPQGNGGVVASVGPKVWTAPTADGTLPSVIPDTFEVRVLS